MSKADVELGQRWGVSDMLVMQLRKQHLREPEDFTQSPQVAYTAAGEKKMAALLKVGGSATCEKEGGEIAQDTAQPAQEAPMVWPPSFAGTLWTALPEWPGSSHALPEIVGLLVLKVWPNPTFVTVRKKDGAQGLVRVKANTRLARGGTLRCREWPDGRVECVHAGVGVPLSAVAPG